MYIVFGVDPTHIRCIKNISDVRRVETLYRHLVAPTARIRWSYVFPSAFVNTLDFAGNVHDTTVFELGKKFNMWLYDQVKKRYTIARQYLKAKKVKDETVEYVPVEDVPVEEGETADDVKEGETIEDEQYVVNREKIFEDFENQTSKIAKSLKTGPEKTFKDLKKQISKTAKYFEDKSECTITKTQCDPVPFSILSFATLCDSISIREDGHCAFKPRKLAAQNGITTIYACPMAMEREFWEKTPIKDVIPNECYVLVKVENSISVFDESYLPLLDDLPLYGIDPAIVTDIKTFPSTAGNLQNILENIAMPSHRDDYLYQMYTMRKFLSSAKPAKSGDVKRIIETMYGHYEVTLDQDAGVDVIDAYLQHKKNHITEMTLCTFVELLDYLGFMIKDKRVLYLKKCMFPHVIKLGTKKNTRFGEPLDSNDKITQLRPDPKITHAPWSFHQAWMLSSKAMLTTNEIIRQLRTDPEITHAPWSIDQAWMLSAKAMIPPA